MRKDQHEFKLEDYESFYEHHLFKPVPDEAAINLHRAVPRIAWSVREAKKLKPKKVLDLGCLEGFTALTLANHVDSIERVVGVDLSQEGIDLANSRKGLIKADSEFIQGTLESFLETANEKFDFITIFEVMEHVKDPELVFKLIDRVSNGVVLVSTPDFKAPTYGKNDVQNKCHIRLFTTDDEDFEEMTDVPDPVTGKTYMRKATSLPKMLGKERIINIGTYSELINCIYK